MDKAYKLLLEPEQRKRALDVIHAGQEYVEHNVSVQHIPLPFRYPCYSTLLICICLTFHFPTGKGEKETVEEGWEAAGGGGGRP